jgi:transposase
MGAYSLDFLQEIINVYLEREPISQGQLAKRFCVAPSLLQKLLKQYRQTQTLDSQTHRWVGQLKLLSKQLVII